FPGAGETDSALLAMLEEASEAVADSDASVRSQVLAQLALELYWTPAHERRTRLATEAVGLLETVTDPAVAARVRTAALCATWSADSLDERIATTAMVKELARVAGAKETEFQSDYFRSASLVEAGRAG